MAIEKETAENVVSLVKEGKLDEALEALKGDEKDASSYHMITKDAIDRAITSGADAVIRELAKANIVSGKEDLYEVRFDIHSQLKHWLPKYLKQMNFA